MSGDVTASVVAHFDQSVNVNLSIEGDPGIYADGLIHLLLHPADNDVSVYASVGDVFKGDVTPVDVKSGIVTFSGSSQAQLPKRPVYTNPEFQVLFAFDAEAQPTSINVKYDAYRNVLSASEECTAAVRYTSYKSSSWRLLYRPKTTTLGVGFLQEYGVIAAFKPPNHVITYDVDATQLIQGTASIELYRRYSKAVVIEENTYEYPTTIANDQGTYSDDPLVLDLSGGYSVIERPHEIGYMDELGTAWVYTPFVSIREPYIGSVGYAPVISKRIATLDPARYPPNLINQALNFIKSRGLYAD